jgi:hypothetical protein
MVCPGATFYFPITLFWIINVLCLVFQHSAMISNDFVIDLDKLSLVQVTKQNMHMLRSLNGVLFPITYSETFYTLLQTPSSERVARIGIDAVVSYC